MIDLTSLRPRKVELPLVSVIVPCYNVEQYIDQCLNSILDNGYPNVEVICVDDHSTDSTVEHIQNLMKSHSNIQLYDNGTDHNIYGGACRNIGMEHAKGKYIYFCDSDDYIFPGLFKECVERCESLNADICCFKFKTRVDGRSFGLEFNAIHDKGAATFDYSGVENLYWFAGPQTWNKFYNREFVESIHARYQPLKNSNDQFFGIMCMSSAKRITALDKTFYFHRMNTKTSVQRDKQKGNNLGDVVSAIRAAHEYVSALPNAKGIRRHFDRYVQCELRYMNNNGFTITQKFVDDMRMCLKEIGCADDELVKMVMGQLESKGEVKEAFERLDSASPNGGEYDVIVSFATYSKRFSDDHIYEFLDGIVNQKTSLNYHIVANMWAQDYQNLP